MTFQTLLKTVLDAKVKSVLIVDCAGKRYPVTTALVETQASGVQAVVLITGKERA